MKDKDFIGMELNGFICSVQHETGSLEWHNPINGGLSIYATPNYSEDNVVPFDYSIDGDYYHVFDLEFPEGLDEGTKKDWYMNMLLGVILIATVHYQSLELSN